MSRIYKATLPTIQKISALKLLAPDPLVAQLLGWDTIRRMFEKEAITMAAVQHPNIVSIHDFDEHDGRPFYVMEFYANNLGTLMGESGRTENDSRIIPTDRALNYTRQTILGIGCLHDAGIIHRDIKPFNLLITDHDTIKIGDFGLSKLRGERYSGPSNLNIGSPYYAAPEQEIDPDHVDSSADLFAVGVILYRMLTGRLPAAGEKDRVPVSHLNSDLDRQWDLFLATAMRTNPQKRFPDAMSMLNTLEELRHHWETHKANVCELSKMDPGQHQKPAVIPSIRHEPIKISPDMAATQFNTDTLWRPQTYIDNAFEIAGDGIVIDHTTSLAWQQSGSAYSRSWQEANHYIEQLRATRFGKRDDWRLPTANELMTLLRPPPKASALCIAPLFDPTQRWIWSADRRSFVSAYYADVDLGFVGWQDFSAPFFVRAVSGPTR